MLNDVIIQLRKDTTPLVLVNDIPMTDYINGLVVTAEVGTPPTVTFSFAANVDIDLSAYVQNHQSSGETIAKLREINPNDLEGEVLSGMSMDDRLVPALLEAIIQKVST